MSAKGNPYENAVAERINGILKDEFSLNETFLSTAAARRAAREAITIYNHERPHLSLAFKKPEEVYYNDDCIKIPHKNDLDLGRDLVFEFVEQYLPGDLGRVRQIFRRNGAYKRYKDFLESRDFLQKWY